METDNKGKRNLTKDKHAVFSDKSPIYINKV